MLTTLAAFAVLAQGSRGCIPLTNNLDVFADVTICPGVYAFDDVEQDGVIRVRASGVTVDLTGVTIVSTQSKGYGVVVSGVDAATIRGGAIHGFRSAVLVRGGGAHLIERCDLSHNRKRPVFNTAADFLAVWPDLDGQIALDQIGNGVVLHQVVQSVVRDCVMTDQQNGIGLFQCDEVTVASNDCSNNEGWGIHVHRSNNCLISHNKADNCFNKMSTYCHDVQQDGCDTAALLLIKASNDNLVIGNSLRNGGDGIFSAAQESAIHWGADRNVYAENDCSLAKHICMEATFTDENQFIGNVADKAGRYGVWLGYSTDAVVAGNSIRENKLAGISNESAARIRVAGNDISRNGVGVELRRGTFPLLDQDSSEYVFEHNSIRDNKGIGLSLVDTRGLRVLENDVIANHGGNVRLAVALETDLGAGPIAVHRNNVIGVAGSPYNVSNEQPTKVDLTENWWGTTDAAAIALTIKGIEQLAVIPPHKLARLEITFLLGADGPYTLRRVVNERADDAVDHAASPPGKGNAGAALALGATGFTTGFRFRDVYLPTSATVLSAALVLPAQAGSAPLSVRISGEANDDSVPFEAGTMPATRVKTSSSVLWSVAAPWTNGTFVATPDVTPIVNEILARPGWSSGNAMAFLLADESSLGARFLDSFDAQGYLALPNTPYEFRHYRKFRFAKLEATFTSIDGNMVLERELGGGTDDADNCLTCNEVNFGFIGGSLTGGFRFPKVDLAPTVALTAAHLWLPTDGTYTAPLNVTIRGELLPSAPAYSNGDLPANRPKTAASVPWPITETWIFTEWHTTPELIPLLQAVMAQHTWAQGNPIAIDVLNAGSATSRRVWAFERDPRVSPHDFPNIGATPFVPFLRGPVRF